MTSRLTHTPPDDQALGTTGKLDPLPEVRERLAAHAAQLRQQVAMDIVADTCHGQPVSVGRLDYLDQLENALAQMDPRGIAARTTGWADEARRATHDPSSARRPAGCRICALVEYVLANPDDACPPAALCRPAPGPPTPSARDSEERTRLPRLRTTFARCAAQAAAHGLGDEVRSARRVLDSTEGRLVRDHLDLVLSRFTTWERIERSWVTNDHRLHQGCLHCTRAPQRLHRTG